jgi:hypothetical protein
MIGAYSITEANSDTGEKVLVYQDNSRRIPLNSMYSPALEAKKFVEAHRHEGAVFVLIGNGNGAIPAALLEQDRLVHLFILEPFDDIPFSPDVVHSDRVTVDYYKNFVHLTASFRAMLEKYRGVKFQIVIHPHYEKTDTNYLKSVLQTIQQGIGLVQLNYVTQAKFRKDWLLEPMLNLEYAMKLAQLQQLRDRYIGQKAVLVASGPSLKESLPHLADMQRSAFIFAAGSAINGLVNNGVVPDFAVTYDSSETNYEAHFKNTLYKGPMFIGSTTNSEIVKHFEGSGILFGMDSDDVSKRFFPSMPYLPSVPSVANATLNIMYYLGFSEVYLVGQDLAMPNGAYYAEGVHQHAAVARLKTDFQVPSNDGGTVGTNSMLYAFLETFNGMIGLIDAERTKVLNLAKHGAKIQGAPYLPVEAFPFEFVREERTESFTKAQSTEEGRDAVRLCATELAQLHRQIQEVLRKLRHVSEHTASAKELKLVLRHLVSLRKNEWFEGVVLNQFSYSLQRLNNFFEYEMDKPNYSNEDRVRMVKEVKNMIQETSDFLEAFLKEPRLTPYMQVNET